MQNPNEWLIKPIDGFTPHMGVLVTTLEQCRQRTLAWTQDLTVHQLDHLFDEDANSIGALLLHIAGIEAAYQEITFHGRNILDNPERRAKWYTPLYLGEAARQEIRGHSIDFYHAELAAMREKTLEQFRQLDDDWLWQESPYGNGVANNYWMWYHVYEDEINHRGAISWLKSRIPRSEGT